ncbi:redox-sensitive bicupin YhaK (pirin superfamily) [Chryseobacterium vietnamense]|uniref:Redox-sensitive bicupin YhaK (Pirin superfamily) n=1 Tax=Chryseobacterium vietnamense TaxID=866785 RepID=A0ACC6JBT0_9FLAO|nr:pirin family protein [Chryseobacterium vietnamense]MDR6460421.1 redox-sensitive bicupin YhaK (pirin superfamily) [Chryseobacterium vietnamense]
MDRKDFLKKGLLGTGMFVASASLASAMKNDIDEIEPLEPIGYNHLPNTESKIKENSVIHRADSRGKADHGWLLSNHTFSFANYYNPERMHFGVLRVLNDDKVEAGRGFGTHPHDNMEIISIPLEGDLEHKDSMGNTAVIRSGDIQVMSAGTGIMHSEFNKNSDKLVKFLQIWIYPKKRNVTPRYDQITLDKTKSHNQFQQILSPNADDEGVWIHQDAWFHLGTFDQNTETRYQIRKKGNGVYVFILKGSAEIGSETLEERDGFGVWDIQDLDIKSLKEGTEILVMDVPMTL